LTVLLNYLWEDYHWKERKGQIIDDIHGYWSLEKGVHGLSISFKDENQESCKLQYMILWQVHSNDQKSQYRLCQVLELPINQQGVVWTKESNEK
jgi:hypothetical protein